MTRARIYRRREDELRAAKEEILQKKNEKVRAAMLLLGMLEDLQAKAEIADSGAKTS